MENNLQESKKIPINKGQISREELIKCIRTNTIKSSINFSFIGLIILVLGISLLVTTLTDGFDAKFLPYILIPCGILILALPFILGMFAPVFLDKQNNTIKDGFVYKYQFDDVYMDIVYDSGVAKLHTKLNYALISKVIYFNDVVFIYLNSTVVYMLKLSGFENKDEMNAVMKKIDRKYKVKKND